MLSCNLQSSSVTPLVQGNGSVRYALIVSGFGNSPIFDPALTVQPIPVKLGNATNFTRISVADTPYTVLSTDEYISVDTSGGAVTVLFPDTPAIGQEWTVKDATGNALLNNITITTVSGTDFIDGSTIDTIASAFRAVGCRDRAIFVSALVFVAGMIHGIMPGVLFQRRFVARMFVCVHCRGFVHTLKKTLRQIFL